MLELTQGVTVHFIGIGGIGMSGLAKLLHYAGIRVSGSDINYSNNIKNLEETGIQIFMGHRQENIKNANVVVYSSAVKEDNVEFICAKTKGIPVLKRAQMLAQLMRLKCGIAVAGTHGKTTTSSFLATILQESGLDPTYIIGGIVANLDGNVGVGTGQYLIAEADESDGSFLELYPCLMIITNIDNDHLDYYKNLKNLQKTFLKFINHLPFYGLCAISSDDAILAKISKRSSRIITTFGVKNSADFMAKNISSSLQETTFELWYKGKNEGLIAISLFGEHNVLNALGAIAIAYRLGINFDSIKRAIVNCKHIGRRQQLLYQKDSFVIISDYAHHPTAISATISSIANIYPGRRLVVIYQPHRYSRTRYSWPNFLHAFNLAESLYLAPIYSAGETEIEGISSERLCTDINNIHPGLATMMYDFNLDKLIATNTVLLCMGAGNISSKVEKWIQHLS